MKANLKVNRDDVNDFLTTIEIGLIVMPDAVETAKQKSVSRKRKEITMLEAQIAAQQEQLKKIKTEVSVKLSSMLCDEEDVLFTELPCKDVATESSETLNLKVSATTTNENIVETEDKGSA